MNKNLLWLPQKILGSFWFTPLILALAGWIAGLGSISFDQSELAGRLAQSTPAWAITVEGGRSLVSTVAGGIVTMASLVFSLTFVALTLMSQQLGPRLIQIFIRDQFAKLTFGLFSGAFLFCLSVLAVTGTGSAGNFVPTFSLFFVVLAAVFSFCLMIIYINHIATSIQADALIVRLGQELCSALSPLTRLPDDSGSAGRDDLDGLQDLIEATDNDQHTINAIAPGYVAQIDEKELASVLSKHNLRGKMLRRPGHFLTSEMPILALDRDLAEGGGEVAEEIQGCLIVEQMRSSSEAGEFEINALVEVALRALSPGINDSYTALACLDQLTMALGDLLAHKTRTPVVCDADGEPRLLLYNQNFIHFLDTAFHPIRHAAGGNPLVLARLVNSCRILLGGAKEKELEKAICNHLARLRESIQDNVLLKHDREHLLSNIKK